MPQEIVRTVRVMLSIVVLPLAAAGCAMTAPVDRPCGVIDDPLRSVEAATPDGDRRLARHFERGVAAGCWTR